MWRPGPGRERVSGAPSSGCDGGVAMRWEKLGRVFAPRNLRWMRSHAAVPCARVIDESVVRVFFSGRDDAGRSVVGFFDLDPAMPTRILRVSERPVLEPGGLGSFDESGAMCSWVLEHAGQIWLYYIGWTRGVTVPFYNSIGLAISGDGGLTFDKVSAGPLISRDRIDPFFTASSCVMVDQGKWKMWYLSCTGWQSVAGQPRHHYHIRYAESNDGIDWMRSGQVCIDYASDAEYAISRPSVVRDGDLYKMWYSYRGESYRIGYAESDDGIHWARKDEEAGIEVSESGWDSQMIEYPCVFDRSGHRYMLFNGNGYGSTGVGLARLVGHRVLSGQSE